MFGRAFEYSFKHLQGFERISTKLGDYSRDTIYFIYLFIHYARTRQRFESILTSARFCSSPRADRCHVLHVSNDSTEEGHGKKKVIILLLNVCI